MSRFKTILIRCITVLQVLCVLAAILFWHILHERELETIELPSGDKIVIMWHPWNNVLFAIAGGGGLRYRIYSGDFKQFGELTWDSYYDHWSDVKLYYDIEGDKQVLIADGRGRYWQFSGNAAGKYEVMDLGRQQEEASEPQDGL